MVNIYKARIELEIGLLSEAHREALVTKLTDARIKLVNALPAGSIVGVSIINKWDEMEKSVLVVERQNKSVI